MCQQIEHHGWSQNSAEFMPLLHLGLLASSMLAQQADRPEVRKRTRCILPPSLNVISNIKLLSRQVWPVSEMYSLVTQCETYSSSMNTFLIIKFYKQYEKRTKKQTGFIIYRQKRPELFKEAVKENTNGELKHSKQDLLNGTKR